MHAFVAGSMFSRLPEIQKHLDIGPGEFGLVLMVIPLGVLSGALLASRLIEAIGTQKTCLIFLPVFATIPFLATLAQSHGQLALVLYFFGAVLAMSNVAINVEADRIEFALDKRILNKCHGSWGLGFLIVSLLGVGAIRLGITPSVHFVILFAVICLASATIVRGLKAAAPREAKGDKKAHGKSKKLALPNKGTFLIVAFALTGFWLEGSTRNWGVIYLRDGLGALDWFAALALPAMISMQTLGRFMADGWISKFGPVAVARFLTTVALVGLIIVILSPAATFALVGFMLIGLGISTAVPQAISSAARWGDRPSAENVAAFSMLQTMIAFIAPPVFGLLAAWFDMQIAWMMFLPLPFVALYFAKSLAPRQT